MLPAQHFDARRLVGNQSAEIELTHEGVGHLDPIDQHQRVVGFRASDADLRLAGHMADRDAGYIAQHIRDLPHLPAFENGLIKHRNRISNAIGGQGIGRAGSRNHERLGIGSIGIRFDVGGYLSGKDARYGGGGEQKATQDNGHQYLSQASSNKAGASARTAGMAGKRTQGRQPGQSRCGPSR